jgi:hypothetical protein
MSISWSGNPSLFTGGVNTVLVEQPDSPIYEFTRTTAKCTRKFRGLHSLCLSDALSPGTVGSGDMSGWIVSKSTINRLPKQIGELVIEYDATAAGGAGGVAVLPLDEYDLQPFEINPRTEQNPFFNDLTADERADVRRAVDSQDDAVRSTKYAALGTLAKKLADKLIAGRDSFYLAGWTYTWSSYSWDLPDTIDNGGYIAAPGGPLETLIASNSSVTWLRQCDHLEWTGHCYKITRTWLGAPNGHWDTDLYS